MSNLFIDVVSHPVVVGSAGFIIGKYYDKLLGRHFRFTGRLEARCLGLSTVQTEPDEPRPINYDFVFGEPYLRDMRHEFAVEFFNAADESITLGDVKVEFVNGKIRLGQYDIKWDGGQVRRPPDDGWEDVSTLTIPSRRPSYFRFLLNDGFIAKMQDVKGTMHEVRVAMWDATAFYLVARQLETNRSMRLLLSDDMRDLRRWKKDVNFDEDYEFMKELTMDGWQNVERVEKVEGS
ncbi:hypothetical protein HED60_19265 [Planctomycetales bacterium ZRK34]|nr:hypothetical protein HED60_19265 [Planctomycetales bacterium ZRK34]